MNHGTAQALIACAREYIGTPFHHQGRARGVGIDCVGLVVCAARDSGLAVNDRTDYQRDPDGVTLVGMIAEQLDPVPLADRRAGDVLAFWVVSPGMPQHIGICTGETMIHAPVGRRVYEHRLTTPMLGKLHSVWRFR